VTRALWRRGPPVGRGVSVVERLVYTVGTSTRTMEEFLALLQRYGVRLVVDVRRFPVSRRYPHFDRAALAGCLRAAGIDYYHLGAELGGYRTGGYEAFTATPLFRAGLERLIELAAAGPAAVMCSERFPWKCHRRFIARHLARAGWRVVHILDPGRTYEEKGGRPGGARRAAARLATRPRAARRWRSPSFRCCARWAAGSRCSRPCTRCPRPSTRRC